MLQLDVRVVGLDLLDDRPPQAARFEDVGLVHARQLLSPAARQFEAKLHHAADLVLGVGERVHDLAAGRRHPLLGRLAEVQAAGQLSHDQQVHVLDQRLAHGRAAGEDRLDGDRPKVRVQAQVLAQPQERLLRPNLRLGIAVPRIPDRAEVDRVRGRALLDVFVADADAVRVDGDPADQHLGPFEAEAEEPTGGLEDAPAARNHLRADPITGNDDEVVLVPAGVVPAPRPGSRSRELLHFLWGLAGGASLLQHGRRATASCWSFSAPDR